MTQLAGKVAVVTGSGSGIGAAAVAELARQGACVAALDLDEDAARRVADTARRVADTGGAASGAGTMARFCDVRDSETCRAALAEAAARFGGVDVLVNSAGVVRYGRIDEISEEEWDTQLDTNLKGVYLMARHAIPLLRRRGGGTIVSVASTQAFASQELVPAYAASKGAIVALTRSLALDHAREGIRVNAVAPGSVDTAMLHYAAARLAPADPDGAISAWGRSHPLGRVITPEEVAHVIAFLAGPGASAVTGATYLVDGGATAKLAT